MTGSEIQKIIESMPDDMKDVLLNGLNDSIEAMCGIADYMRKNFVPVSVINDIQEEIDEEWYRVKRESYERAEGLELASEIITKHTSGAKMGRWVGIDEEPHEDYECNKCGYVVSTFTANIEPHTEYKYCPNCGAKMEGEE